METIHDCAPIYALGALDGEELIRYEAHLRAGCDVCAAVLDTCAEVASHLAYALPPIAPAPDVRTRLMAKVQTEAAVPPSSPGPPSADPVTAPASSFISLRSHEGPWDALAPGIQVKRLYSHPTRDYTTALVRLAPGTYYPRHRHLDTEELFVVEGQCHIDGRLFGPGDYHRAEGSSLHEITYTEGGCMFLLIASGGGHAFE